MASDAQSVAAAFAQSMQSLGPFEPQPWLAVAVSGGADSMALCLLADQWARGQGGQVSALSVDHRLRPEAATEAQRVGDWLSGLGITHHILVWEDPKPATGIQAAARGGRYRLLRGWCRNAGVLYLLVGHQADDQAETVLHRLQRGSGARGLSGIAPVVETPDVHILRPLLEIERWALRGLLTERRIPWVEDPSNADTRFARGRMRKMQRSLTAAGLSPPALRAAAKSMAAARSAMDEAVAALAARTCRVHPTGFVRLTCSPLLDAAAEVAVRLLIRVIAAVGGLAWECADAPVRRLLAGLRAAAPFGAADRVATTAGRCRLRLQGSELWVIREVRDLPPPCAWTGEREVLWDGRFRVRLAVPTMTERAHSKADAGDAVPETLLLQAATPGDLRIIDATKSTTSLPAAVGLTTPVLHDALGLLQAPLSGFRRPGTGDMLPQVVNITWCPRQSITGAGYFLV